MKEKSFYGREQATVPAITDEYPGIDNPVTLYERLKHIWCEYTCAPRLREEWSEENITLGQCSITAFLVQDIFGGMVMYLTLPVSSSATRFSHMRITRNSFVRCIFKSSKKKSGMSICAKN